MKHDKKHKKNKSSKRSKKSKKTDRKEKKHKHKQKKKISKKLEKELKNSEEMQVKVPAKPDEDDYCGPSIGNGIGTCCLVKIFINFYISDLMNRAKCPETKAEYDHRQNQIKRVVDKETGRIR